jgi:hypothetical protein
MVMNHDAAESYKTNFFYVLQKCYICKLEVKFMTFGMGKFQHRPPGKEGG